MCGEQNDKGNRNDPDKAESEPMTLRVGVTERDSRKATSQRRVRED